MNVPAFIPTGVLAPLRNTLDAMRAVLNGGATLAATMLGEVKVVRYVSPETLTFSTKLKGRPLALVILGAAAIPSDGTVIGGVPSFRWSWSDASGTGQITLEQGLDLNIGPWDVTFWIVGG